MTDILEYLVSYVSPDYRFIKLRNCTYRTKSDVLAVVFLYDGVVESKLDELKTRLECDFKKTVNLNVKYKFEYRKSYIDTELLRMKVRNFLCKEYNMMTIGMQSDDIKAAESEEGFIINVFISKQAVEYIPKTRAYQNFIKDLHDEYFCTFSFYFNVKDDSADEESLENLTKHMESSDEDGRVDKSLRVSGIEYYLGKPIKERPVKIEFLKVSAEEQVTGGTIKFLTRREYTKNGEQKPYYTFVLDDGFSKVSCVFFLTEKTKAKFEKLVDGTVICAIGVHSERNGRVGLRVNGISFCELAS